MPLLKAFKKVVANAPLVWMDHTHNHVLTEERRRREIRAEGESTRVGMNTSGFLARTTEGQRPCATTLFRVHGPR